MNLIATTPFCNQGRTTAGDVRLPVADIHETPELVRIRFNVPGAGPEDLDVTFENQTLQLATKSTETPGGAPVYQRSVRIPRDLDAASMKASLKHGVLEVELPKVSKPAAVTIPIVS
jgi:HSP20 family molecular chaperone IbpA